MARYEYDQLSAQDDSFLACAAKRSGDSGATPSPPGP